jgi:hypothetical protein
MGNGNGGGSKYRLYLDGSIYERNTSKFIKYLYKQEDIEKGMQLRGLALDYYIKKFIQ